MTHRVLWTQDALANISEIYEFIEVFNPSAARRMADQLLAAGDSLCDFPSRGGQTEFGSRELTVVWPYVIRYSLQNEVVTITRIRHGAREPD